ncbi:inositol monophosphatase [bacterium]|jgi:myo-inositol-1(or 4)-monophosphatase|nr:inositol monophosphatase [bacterium]MBT3794862.1 inositol monophosphatase [bacterium]MBT4634287.1 inositol monophosphatase [bacterium]
MNNKIKKVLKLACLEAGKVILKNYGTIKSVKSKGRNDWVTKQDILIERRVIKIIKRDFPDSAFIGEETGVSSKKMDMTWIIDPIDGTNNYIHDYPFFCTSIGVMIKGEMTHGAVYDPLREEFFYAQKDHGAFMNEKRIKVSEIRKLSDSLLCTGFITSKVSYAKKNISNFTRLVFKARSIRRDGSAALDLAYVACGRLDGFWELGLNSWDTSAGVLLVEEAGGKVINSKGKKFNILENKSLISANKYLVKKLLVEIKSNQV